MMKPVFWITMAYALCRTLMAESLPPLLAYGALFCLSAALIIFFEDVIEE